MKKICVVEDFRANVLKRVLIIFLVKLYKTKNENVLIFRTVKPSFFVGFNQFNLNILKKRNWIVVVYNRSK